MPIYDYACESCGHVVEVIHAIAASGPTTCERCGGRMKRALSAPAIVFKGSGWAKKDARDASRSKSTVSTKGDDAASSTDTSGGAGAGGAGEPAAASTKSDTPAAATSDAGGGSTKASTPATPTAGASGGSGTTG